MIKIHLEQDINPTFLPAPAGLSGLYVVGDKYSILPIVAVAMIPKRDLENGHWVVHSVYRMANGLDTMKVVDDLGRVLAPGSMLSTTQLRAWAQSRGLTHAQ